MRILSLCLFALLGCEHSYSPWVSWAEYKKYGSSDSGQPQQGNGSQYFDFEPEDEQVGWPYLRFKTATGQASPVGFLDYEHSWSVSFLLVRTLDHLGSGAYVLLAQSPHVLSLRPFRSAESDVGWSFVVSLLQDSGDHQQLVITGNHQFSAGEMLTITYDDNGCSDEGSNTPPILQFYVDGMLTGHPHPDIIVQSPPTFCNRFNDEANLDFGQYRDTDEETITNINTNSLVSFNGAIDNLVFHDKVITSIQMNELRDIDIYQQDNQGLLSIPPIMWFNMGDDENLIDCTSQNIPYFSDPVGGSIAEWRKCDKGAILGGS